MSGAGHALVNRGDKVVPEQHERGHDDDSGSKADDGALHGVVFLINIAGRAAEAGRAYDVHKAAPGAGAADRDHLYEADHDGDESGGDGAVDEAADADDDVLEVKVEEVVDAREYLRYPHDHIGQGGEHGEDGELLSVDFPQGGGGFSDIHYKCTSRQKFDARRNVSSGRNYCKGAKYASSLIQTVTVGIGLAPIHAAARLADFTADREFHPALKTSCSFVAIMIAPLPRKCKRKIDFSRRRR